MFKQRRPNQMTEKHSFGWLHWISDQVLKVYMIDPYGKKTFVMNKEKRSFEVKTNEICATMKF